MDLDGSWTADATNPLLLSFQTVATPDVPGLTVRYSFGDGALADGVVGTPVTHQYAASGKYLAATAAAAQPPGYDVRGDSFEVNI